MNKPVTEIHLKTVLAMLDVPIPLVMATNRVLEVLPKHSVSLTIEHNPHKLNYESVEVYLSRSLVVFRSERDKDEAIALDELWTLQWYPDTPVGFQSIAAQRLYDLLVFAQSVPH